MGDVEVPLSERRTEYAAAEERAETASAAYLTARAAGRMPDDVYAEMDAAQSNLLRCKRRLEQTERRLAKRAAR